MPETDTVIAPVKRGNPFRPGDLLTIHRDSTWWEVIRVDDLDEAVKIAPYDENDPRDPQWSSLTYLHLVPRCHRGIWGCEDKNRAHDEHPDALLARQPYAREQ